MDFGLPAPFCFGLGRATTLGESVEVILVGPLAVLGSGGSNRLLLRGVISGSAISGRDNNVGSPKDTFGEAFGRG